VAPKRRRTARREMERRAGPGAASLLRRLQKQQVNLALVAFSRLHGNLNGQVLAFLSMVVAAAEVVVGLAIIVNVYRRLHSANVDDASLLRW